MKSDDVILFGGFSARSSESHRFISPCGWTYTATVSVHAHARTAPFEAHRKTEPIGMLGRTRRVAGETVTHDELEKLYFLLLCF